MSDTQGPQATPVSMERVLEKLKTRLADQVVQLAMYESYIDGLTEQLVAAQSPPVTPVVPQAQPEPVERISPEIVDREIFRETARIAGN